MAQVDNYNESFESEGLLTIQEESSSFQTQFSNWMEKKGIIESSTGEKNAILANILLSLTKKDSSPQEFLDVCFSRDGFEKGGGYDKTTFDKACI